MDMIYQTLDLNNDGMISQKELSIFVRRLEVLGKLPVEYPTVMSLMAAFDTNYDGSISKAEFMDMASYVDFSSVTQLPGRIIRKTWYTYKFYKNQKKFIFHLWFQYVKTLVATIQYVIFFVEESKNQGKKDYFLIILLPICESSSPSIDVATFSSGTIAKSQERSKTTLLSAPTTRKERSNAKKKKKERGRIEERS